MVLKGARECNASTVHVLTFNLLETIDQNLMVLGKLLHLKMYSFKKALNH